MSIKVRDTAHRFFFVTRPLSVLSLTESSDFYSSFLAYRESKVTARDFPEVYIEHELTI